jgi:hypothetical protein
MSVVVIGPYTNVAITSITCAAAWVQFVPAARAKKIVLKPNDVSHTFKLASEVVHCVEDGTNTISSPNATTDGSLHTLLNEMKTDCNAHFADATVHDAADTANAIAAGNASDEATSVTLVNELWLDLVAHTIESGVHFTHDTFTALTNPVIATNYATAKTLANLLKAFYEAHRVLTADAWMSAAAGATLEWLCMNPGWVLLSTSGSISVCTYR